MPALLMNSSPFPQDPSAQRQVDEKGPEGARAPGGLPGVTPLCQQQEVLQLRGGGQRAPVQLPGRECLCHLPVVTLTQGVMGAPSFPSFRNHTALWGVEASALPRSQPHSTCVPAFKALNVTAGRV